MSIELIAEIVPKNNGKFALIDDKVIRGGFHCVNSILERNNISSDRRKEGMLVAVISNNTIWQLKNGIENVNWSEFTVASEITEISSSFSWGDSTPVIIYLFTSSKTIRTIQLSIDEIFNGIGASIKIGDNYDDGILMNNNQNIPFELGVYETNPMKSYSIGDKVILTITPGNGASSGSGLIKILF